MLPKKIIISLSILCGLGLIYVLTPDQTKPEVHHQQSSNPTEISAQPSRGFFDPAHNLPPPPPSHNAQSLLEDFYKNSDYFKFASTVNPINIHYRELAAGFCFNNAHKVSKLSNQASADSKLGAAVAFFKSHCQDKTSREWGVLYYKINSEQPESLFLRRNKILDPISSLSVPYAEKKEVIRSILNSKDPLLIFGPYGTTLTQSSKKGSFFDQHYLSKNDMNALYAATIFLQCEMGVRCNGQDDLLLIDACIARGQCFATRSEYLDWETKNYSKGKVTLDLARVEHFRSRLKQIIDNNDADAFLPAF